MARQKNWTVDASHGGGAPGNSRNLNFSDPNLRKWYSDQLLHYLTDGVDFWWNDEGETTYLTFHYWNSAEISTQNKTKGDSKKRFWSINRSFSPGMQRLGAATWTGDVDVSWKALQQQPGTALNSGLSGTNLVTCDIGGFTGGNATGLLLTRWYQYGVFMPLMRIHSTLYDKPHFPFLYGEEVGDALRKALNLRYTLIPYLYSLAHHSFGQNGIPMMRPLAVRYPQDPKANDLTSEWLLGDGLLVAPVLTPDNSTEVYLPDRIWYPWNSPSNISGGGVAMKLVNVPLHSIPMYASAGSIIPLGPVLQYSSEPTTEPLQVAVYPGVDGSFELVEDDGESLAYTESKTRKVNFQWSEAKYSLSWKVEGVAIDSPSLFAAFVVTVYSPQKGVITKGPASIGPIGSSGQLVM